MTTALPDLSLIARRVEDELDHPDGGHCVSLSRTAAEGTRELVDQYLTALTHLAERAADEPDGGWLMTRPILFHAHHTAELALKSALMAASVEFEPRHGLVALWESATASGLDRLVANVDGDWCHAYVSLVADLAGDSIGARYAEPNRNHIPIDDVWCCVDPKALTAATETFALLCVAMAQAIDEIHSP